MASETNVAQDQIKGFVDRILRMKAEAKAINADVREIYGEAKAVGFDKTVLGKLVTYVEKRQEDSNAVLEKEAIFDLYLTAYDSAAGKVGTKRATHAHASEDADEEQETQPLNPAGQMRTDPVSSSAADGGRVGTSLAGAEGIANRQPIPQPTKAAGSDLAEVPPANNGGQVADNSDIASPISNDKPEANEHTGSDPQRSVAPIRKDGGSDASGDGPDKSVEAPASAAPASIYPEPGEVYWENTPRQPAKQHEYSRAFGTLGQDIHVITEDIAKAQSAAIVMMGDTILDGWARYNCARGMVGMNGQTTDYPAYQYDGADPLLDCIRWNMEGRILDVNQRQIIAKRLIALEPKRKDDIIKAFGFAMEFAA